MTDAIDSTPDAPETAKDAVAGAEPAEAAAVVTDSWEEANQELYVANRQIAGLAEAIGQMEQDLEVLEPELLKLRKSAAGVALPLGQLVVRTFSSPLGPLRFPLGLVRLIRARARRRRVQAARRLLQAEGFRVVPARDWRAGRLVRQTPDPTRPVKAYAPIFHELVQLAETIPDSNGSQYHRPLELDVAIVTDEFMFNYYKNVFRKVVYLTPENHAQAFAENRFDLFLFVSCWSGMANDEWRGVRYREKPQAALKAILEASRERGIPTLFQTIEDPSNYEHFIDVARQFDHIFTTDVDCVERYRRDTPARTVAFAEFGANPLFNHPIGMRRKAFPGAFFAGSYPSRYPDRCKDMHTMFDALARSDVDLIIADRNSDKPSPTVAFPTRYAPHLVAKLGHHLLQKVHKVFAYNINFNSIKNSPTMCAMRIYELQAQGSLLLSNYARSVVNRFPSVDVITSPVDMKPYLERAATLDGYEARVIAIRQIMTARTAFDQTRRMLEAAGVALAPEVPRTVLVVLLQDTDALRAMADAQHYPHRFCVPADLAAGLDLSEFAYVAFFASGHEYESHYLTDMVNAFKYTASRYVTKAAWFDTDGLHDGPQHEFVDHMPDLARTVFDAAAFSIDSLLALDPGQPLAGGYSIDPFELNYTRHLEARAQRPEAYALSVIVPVYNNGDHLRHKCLASLQRNELFGRMELVIVDDGSKDPGTLETLRLIERRHANVRVFRFPTGGSGSASRARNKGVELASAPLVAFLDPDNEISPRGYDRLHALYERLEREGRPADLVSGYQLKVGATQTITAKHSVLELTVYDDPRRDVLLERNFPIISTQAAVIRREFLRECKVDFVLGAIGQDTLYAYELLSHAGRIAFTNAAHIVYYAEREDSVTNTLNRRFFERSLALEQAQVERLRRTDLLDDYKRTKFAEFFVGWYVAKLRLAAPEAQEQARAALAQIARLYGADARTLIEQDTLS
jgi:glycosyltransferase involved in cell wall biosynthesis